MAAFVKSDEFKLLNVGFVLDEGSCSSDDKFSVMYGERSAWSRCIQNITSKSDNSLLRVTFSLSWAIWAQFSSIRLHGRRESHILAKSAVSIPGGRKGKARSRSFLENWRCNHSQCYQVIGNYNLLL